MAVIGGGPAGLMAAEVLSSSNFKVDVYDAMPSVGRKFLLAGKGGMNLTHSEPFNVFLSRYEPYSANLKPLLDDFNPDAVRHWAHDLGIDTFVGSSGRVFPKDMKAAPLLRAWLHRLRAAGISFHSRHQWLGWVDNNPKQLRFQTPDGERQIYVDAVILALGGGSWEKLGSTGAWVQLLIDQGVSVNTLKPANCGFNVNWSPYFREHFAGQPVKNVRLSLPCPEGQGFNQAGEFVITENGVEGGAIYALSALARENIAAQGCAEIHIDLAPDRSVAFLMGRLAQPRGKQSLSNYLRKRLHLDTIKIALLREIVNLADFDDPATLCSAIKKLPIHLVTTRPIDEAISTAGGINFEALDKQLMIRSLPGVFCAGEMLDWEAPTGGYLLTACFASGRAAGLGASTWLHSQ
ncbi:putative flavoprotein, PP_4765 family [Crenothrix polyspora]|uniref:Putative flavoprotein, PP_4765 family n=1 Tax=Crenothrix polyspora TaxID=360316 RepID=A0A1R4H5J0_9GAMM|nr:TIGR03862 family flavoprotein [Crenothrix polyspora]SJM91538.1 putative flavoprotein, PP_4765 family [Crenothrix polyspora]